MNTKILKMLFSNIQKSKTSYIKIYDSTLLTKDNQKMKKQLLQQSLLSLVAPTFLMSTSYYYIALVSLIYGSIKFSNWIQLYQQNGKYIEQIYVNKEDEIYVILDNKQAFLCPINNVQCNLSLEGIKKRLESIQNQEVIVFPFQLKNVQKCTNISNQYALHNNLFYLVIDNIENEKQKIEKNVLQQILNKMKNPILKLNLQKDQ